MRGTVPDGSLCTVNREEATMWYLLPEAYARPETLPMLQQHVIPAMQHATVMPRPVAGIAFDAGEHQPEDILIAIGVMDAIANIVPTDTEGVMLLEFAERTQPEIFFGQPTVNLEQAAELIATSEPFAQTLASAQRRIADEARATLAQLREAESRAARAHFLAARNVADAATAVALYDATAAERVQRLYADHDALTQDARVRSVAVVALPGGDPVRLVIETEPLELATTPKRRLGSYLITVELPIGTVLIAAHEQLAEYPHPSVALDGTPYLGQLRATIIRRLARGDIRQIVTQLLDFLEAPPAFQPIPAMDPARWPEVAAAAPAPRKRRQAVAS